jgi:NAD(P) transhydrogenase subunit alpha
METLVGGIVVFVLAMLLGVEIIKKVPTLLHTPLTSGANAISGITVIGAVFVAGTGATEVARILGIVAVTFATINIVGGYLVTDRMLQMFRKKDDA